MLVIIYLYILLLLSMVNVVFIGLTQHTMGRVGRCMIEKFGAKNTQDEGPK